MSRFAAISRAALDQDRAKPRLAPSRADTGPGQAPLSLVALSDAVRALQHDSQTREEQCREAKRLSQDAHQRTAELRKRIDGLEVRCEGLEASWKRDIAQQLVRMRDEMARAAEDVAGLRSSMGTVKQAQERGEHVLRQAVDDSRALGLAVSELGHFKVIQTAAEARAAEQGRVLDDARGELGALQQRQAALVSDAAAYKARGERSWRPEPCLMICVQLNTHWGQQGGAAPRAWRA